MAFVCPQKGLKSAYFDNMRLFSSFIIIITWSCFYSASIVKIDLNNYLSYVFSARAVIFKKKERSSA